MPSSPSAPPGLKAPMLKKRFSSPNERLRSGVAFAVPSAARRRSSVHGRAARTNGPDLGADHRLGLAQERDHGLVRPGSLRIGWRSDSSDERSTGANSRTFASARSDARSEAGSRATDAEIASSSFARASNTLREAVTSRRRSCGWLADLGHQQAVVVDQLLEVVAALARSRA